MTYIATPILLDLLDNMSNTGDNPTPYLLNRFPTPTSRLNRTNIQAKSNQTGSSQGEQSESSKTGKIQRSTKNQELMPHKVSQLSQNVLFQDMDQSPKQSPKKYQRHPRKSQPVKAEQPKQFTEEKAMGAINNVFMGATTKYNKMTIQTNITPTKHEQEAAKSPKNSETSSQHSGFGGPRFARRKRNQLKHEQVVQPIDLSVQSNTPKGGLGTDRSNADGKKIQRKNDKNRHLFRHEKTNTEEKKDTSSNKIVITHTPSTVTQNTVEPQQKVNQNRYSRPVQRQNQSGTNSRVNTQKEEVQKQTTPASTTSTINRQRPYPNRQIPSKPQVTEPSPQSDQKNQEEPDIKPKPVIQRKPYNNRAKNTPSQQIEQPQKQSPKIQSPQKQTSKDESNISTPQPQPIQRSSNRYGANRQQIATPQQKTQQENKNIQKSAPRTYGNRYGAKKIEQTQNQNKQIQQKPVNKQNQQRNVNVKTPPPRNINRYGANRNQQVVETDKKHEEQKIIQQKPTPIKNRFASTKPQSTTQKNNNQEVQIQKSKPFVRQNRQPGKQISQTPQQISQTPKQSPIQKTISANNNNIRGDKISSKVQSKAASLAGSKVEQKIMLKKSAVVMLVFKRLLQKQLSDTFNILKNNKKVIKLKMTMEVNILAYQSAQIVKHKENNLVKMGFDQLRKKMASSFITSAKPILNAKLGNPSQTLFNILHHISQSKVRDVFKTLNNKFIYSQKIKSITTLQMLLKAKEKSYEKNAINSIYYAAKRKLKVLESFSKIVSLANKQLLAKGFNKLLSIRKEDQKVQNVPSKPQPRGIKPRISTPVEEAPKQEQSRPDPALKDKSQKLKNMNSSLTSNIDKMQGRMQVLKKEKKQVVDEFNPKIKALQKQNAEIQDELAQKKNRNSEVTKQLAGISGKTQRKIVQQDLQPKSQKLQILTNIYIGNFKLQEHIQSQDIINEYCLDTNDANMLLNQWNLLLQNNSLKKEIASYQQLQMTQSKARRTLMNQQQAILKLVRSYVKEQYFWQWLHVSVDTL